MVLATTVASDISAPQFVIAGLAYPRVIRLNACKWHVDDILIRSNARIALVTMPVVSHFI